MINLAELGDTDLWALAEIMEQDGNKEAAEGIRAIIAKRQRDRKELEDRFRHRGISLWRE